MGIVCWIAFSFWYGVGGAVGAFIVVAFILKMNGSTWFQEIEVIPANTTERVPRQVTEKKRVAEHRCCIQCKHPIKSLR